MYPQMILSLIESCENAAHAGVCREDIRNQLLPDKVQHLVKNLPLSQFLDWAEHDPDYSFYYREVHQSGINPRPHEAAAMILEAIVLDAIE